MTITQTGNTVSITSTPQAGYRFIHAIQKVTSTVTTLVNDTFTDSASSFTLESDGYYIISETKLTTTPGAYYYISGDTVYSSVGVEITVEDLLEEELEQTTFVNHFSRYNVNEYYINLLKSKFLNNICACNCISTSEKLTIDMLTMGITLIDSLVIDEQFYEAERIVEQLGTCTNTITPSCNCNG